MSSSVFCRTQCINEYIQNWDGGGYVEVPETWKLLTGVADICTYNMP